MYYSHLLSGGIALTRGVSSFGSPPNPIFVDNLACTGSESSILDCPSGDLGFHRCDHSQDAGVQCFGMVVWLCNSHNGDDVINMLRFIRH